LKDTLAVGLTSEAEHVMTAAMGTDHLPVPVLMTPTMVGLIEAVCMQAVAPHLSDGQTTVGTHVCVSHESGVSEGQTFTIRCRLTAIRKRRLEFDTEVECEGRAVSRGTHQRTVVDLAARQPRPPAALG
jgi:fluoroacetyl-CoA thioesterase